MPITKQYTVRLHTPLQNIVFFHLNLHFSLCRPTLCIAVFHHPIPFQYLVHFNITFLSSELLIFANVNGKYHCCDITTRRENIRIVIYIALHSQFCLYSLVNDAYTDSIV